MRDDAEEIQALRRFNRLYTQRIGLLEPSYAASPFTLTQARVLHEIAERRAATAAAIAADLGLDMGYLSRILAGFQRQGLVVRTTAAEDRRSKTLALTPAGRAAYRRLKGAAERDASALLDRLTPLRRDRLVRGMGEIETALADAPSAATLRPHRPGDIAYVLHRQAVLYVEEYGWDGSFETLLLKVGADFLRGFDPAREACWIAELDGAIVGSVFLVRESDTVGRLRLLYVEPSARGHGIGQRLVAACVERAREAGYARLTLWTNDILTTARHIYDASGFRLVAEKPHHSFGKDLVGQDWDLAL